MGRVLSTIIAVALLLGLGALAVLALPGAGAPMTAGSVVAAPLAAEPDAPAAGVSKYNVIGMPLDAAAQFTSLGGFNSDGLGNLLGTSVTQVLAWNTTRQEFDSWDPIADRGTVDGVRVYTPFDLAVGGSYWLLVDSLSPDVVSFVGDVPLAGSVKYGLSAGPTGCTYNAITIPLDQSTLTDADLLGEDISAGISPIAVSQVLQWNASRQEFDSWDPGANRGTVDGVRVYTPFATKIGYPYWVCILSTLNAVNWP